MNGADLLSEKALHTQQVHPENLFPLLFVFFFVTFLIHKPLFSSLFFCLLMLILFLILDFYMKHRVEVVPLCTCTYIVWLCQVMAATCVTSVGHVFALLLTMQNTPGI